MSEFTQFSAIEQLQYAAAVSKERGKDYWRVAEGYRYYIGTYGSNRYVEVPAGFLTDGATIPRALWWLLPPMGEYSQATTLHDYLCSTYEITVVENGVPTQVRITRKEIDDILTEAMEVLGVTAWKEFVINAGVDFYRIMTDPTEPKVQSLVVP